MHLALRTTVRGGDNMAKKVNRKSSFYDALSNVYHDVVIASENERLYHLWKDRLETVLNDFSSFFLSQLRIHILLKCP